MKLRTKFFLAFLLTNIMVVAAMVVAMRFYARATFAEYVHRMEVSRIGEVVEVLASEYEQAGGWDSLYNNSRRWCYLLRPRRFSRALGAMPTPPPDFVARLADLIETVQAAAVSRQRAADTGSAGGDGQQQAWVTFEMKLGDGTWPAASAAAPSAFKLERRITLFDDHRHPVAGPAESVLGLTLQEITVNGRVVGWLGIKPAAGLTHPLDVRFLRDQAYAFYTVGCLILLVAAVVSFVLARNMLSPVRKLTRGTRALAERQFDTRIRVSSRDELGQLAADFNAMAQTLERYEHLRQQWLSDISHELRTPLAVLRAELEALQDGIRPATPETVASLHDEVLHLGQIVQDLHDLSLAESGSFVCRREQVAPAAVLARTVERFRHRFADGGIALDADRLSGAQSLVLGDGDRLTQLFANLLENSLRYTDAPGTLTLWQETAGAELRIHFADSAPGVPAESLERLFDKLYRVDPSRSRANGGSGLGLAICKSIVDAHGGRISAAQAAAGGLHIVVTLPCLGAEEIG